MKSRPSDIEFSEVQLAVLLGDYCTLRDDLKALRDLVSCGHVPAPPGLDRALIRIGANIDALCDELHGISRTAGQLHLFEDHHARH